MSQPFRITASLMRVLALSASLLPLLVQAPVLAQNTPARPHAAPAKPAAAAPAQPIPQRLAEYDGWAAYSYGPANSRVCYLVGKPTKSEPANARRGEVTVLVTHRVAEKATNVVSFVAGYPFRAKSDAEIEIDGRKFTFFTDQDTAWARDPATDRAVVEAMVKGKQVAIKGNSQHGGTTDFYNLTGFGRALGEIDKACQVKR